MTEANGKQMGNFNPTEKRTAVLANGLCNQPLQRKKRQRKGQKREKMSWTRILVMSVEAYGKLLDSVQLEDLSARVEKLEQNKPGGVC